jgi:hypothetical protein
MPGRSGHAHDSGRPAVALVESATERDARAGRSILCVCARMGWTLASRMVGGKALLVTIIWIVPTKPGTERGHIPKNYRHVNSVVDQCNRYPSRHKVAYRYAGVPIPRLGILPPAIEVDERASRPRIWAVHGGPFANRGGRDDWKMACSRTNRIALALTFSSYLLGIDR